MSDSQPVSFTVQFPGIFALNGSQPAGLPDRKSSSLYLVTSDINSAVTTGAGQYLVNGVELENGNLVPFTTNCCESILFTDISGPAFAFNQVAATLRFDELKVFAPNSLTVIRKPSSFTVTRVGFRYLGAGDFSFISDDFSVAYTATAQDDYTYFNPPTVIPVPASGLLVPVAMLYLLGVRARPRGMTMQGVGGHIKAGPGMLEERPVM